MDLIFTHSSRDECEAQIKGYPGAKHKKFTTESEARLFAFPNLTEGSQSQAVSASSGTSTPTTAGLASDPKGKKRALGPEVPNSEEWDVVYSDGACKGNGKKDPVAGVGVWWGPHDPRYGLFHATDLRLTNSILPQKLV